MFRLFFVYLDKKKMLLDLHPELFPKVTCVTYASLSCRVIVT